MFHALLTHLLLRHLIVERFALDLFVHCGLLRYLLHDVGTAGRERANRQRDRKRDGRRRRDTSNRPMTVFDNCD